MNNKKSLVKFNVQNAKYALAEAPTAPVPFGSARKIALEANSATKPIYGDGRVILTMVNDKGKTGTLTLNVVPDAYEVAMGRKMQTANGLADIKQTVNKRHHIYFEVCEIVKGDNDTDEIHSVAKTWLYGVATTRPSESYEQTEDDTKESAFDLPLDIAGTPVLNADGTPYKVNGVEIYAWQMTVTPGDPGYDTFGNEVRFPELAAPTPAMSAPVASREV